MLFLAVKLHGPLLCSNLSAELHVYIIHIMYEYVTGSSNNIISVFIFFFYYYNNTILVILTSFTTINYNIKCVLHRFSLMCNNAISHRKK